MHSNKLTRRHLLKAAGALCLLPVIPAASARSRASAGRVVVVGGGFGGATAAKYIKRADPAIDVTLIEPKATFYTCPFSNLVLAGERSLDQIGHHFYELQQVYGVKVIQDWATDVDPVAHRVTLATGNRLDYDRLLMSPGVAMRWDALEGYDPQAAEHAPHAWEAGEQTVLLRRQLEAMDDGGVFILSAPANPFRCPPGPYERVSLIAHYFAQHKPRSKILILDAKDNFSKQGLFTAAWQKLYGDRIEWIGLSGDGRVLRVDAAKREVETEFGSRHQASVLNVVPPQKAAEIAERAGLTNASGWVPIKPQTFESQQAEDIYVVGDATIAAPMPKSGFAANTQGKVAAAAIVASLQGREPLEPHWANTCYSLVSPDYGISVAGVYRLEQGEIISVAGAGGLSATDAPAEIRQAEAANAVGWYQAISQDTWGTGLG